MSCFVWNKSVIIILYTLLQVNIWSCIFKKNITSPAPYLPWHTTTISFHRVTLKSPRPPSRSISFRSLAEQPSLGWTREGRLEWRKWFFCEISWISGNWNMLLQGNTFFAFFHVSVWKKLYTSLLYTYWDILKKCQKKKDGVVLQGTNVVKQKETHGFKSSNVDMFYLESKANEAIPTMRPSSQCAVWDWPLYSTKRFRYLKYLK